MEQFMSQKKFPPISMKVVASGGYRQWKMRRVRDDFVFSAQRLRRTVIYGRPAYRVDKMPTHLDAWALRELFLSIRNESDALQFLNEAGPFYPSPKGRAAEARLSEIMLCQEMIKDNLLTRGGTKRFPKKWDLYRVLPNLELTVAHGPLGPMAIMVCKNGLAAVWASIVLDEAAGAEFRRCKRQDCPNVFKRESRHDTIYCSHRCGHLVAVRNSRAAKKAASRRKHGKR